MSVDVVVSVDNEALYATLYSIPQHAVSEIAAMVAVAIAENAPPQPDRWEDAQTDTNGHPEDKDNAEWRAKHRPVPEGYEPCGPWKQYAATSNGEDFAAHWHRPLRKIKGGAA